LFWFLHQIAPYIGVGVGLPLVGVGIFLGWRIKQLWLVYDPDRSMAYVPFDYLWDEEEPA
jgi:hypothetical protein